MESRKTSLKYKGVVPQPNCRWGAQVYDNHQRVWLGTFNDENEAARAFDVAAQRFRGRDAAINFEPINDEAEGAFLESHSKDEIADMLRNHSYSDELAQYKKRWVDGGGSFGARDGGGTAREDLFEKAVAPSDVELNRLVVPKQHAEKHFSPLNSGTSANVRNGVLLNFEDAVGKIWRFRYSYWSTSQNHVLTRGWSRFVKENNLKAGDTVSFHRSMGSDKKLYIDFKRKGSRPPSGSVIGSVPVQPVRLFGVNIFDVGENSGCGET